MNDSFGFFLSMLAIAIGLGVGLSCIGDGLKAIAKTMEGKNKNGKI